MGKGKRTVGFGGGPAASRGPTPLFVRIPKAEADKLSRAAFRLGRPKQEIVASLIARHVDPDAPEWPSLDLDAKGLAVGRHTFGVAPPGEVLTSAELAELLEVDEDTVIELAEKGGIPGRKLADAWRFSRRAVLDWLGSAA
jgi:excisionase family DNA binding protein